jgi:hypothetical protein
VEERPGAVLKAWESKGLIGVLHPQLDKRHPHYESLAHILKSRDDLRSAGLRPRMATPVTYAVFGRLKPRERAAALHKLGFRAAEVDNVAGVEDEAQKIVKALTNRKTAAPGDAYAFLEQTPGDVLAVVMAESSNSKAVNKIRTYLQKWRPLQQTLPGAIIELESLGMARGPKFDKVIEGLFNQQLAGKGRSPEDRTKLLRKLSGIKEIIPKKVKEEKEKKKPDEKLKGKLIAKGQPAAAGVAAPPVPAESAKIAAQKTGAGRVSAKSRPAAPAQKKAGTKAVARKKA